MPVESYTAGDTDDLVASLKRGVEGIKVDAQKLSEVIAKEGIEKAKNLAKERMPSGGGSYLDSIGAYQTGAGNRFSVKLFSNHEWAQAVEYGTKDHDIKAKFGGIGAHAAAMAARESSSKFKIPKKKIFVQRPLMLSSGTALGKYYPVDQGKSRRSGWRGEKLEIAQKHYAVTDIWKGKGPYQGMPIYDIHNERKLSELDYQATLGHELLHRYTAKKTGHMKMHDKIDNDPTGTQREYYERLAERVDPWIRKAIDQNTKSGKMKVKSNDIANEAGTFKSYTWDVEKAGGGRLIFEQHLPKGATMGAKYINGPKFVGEQVHHPGARAFNIIGDTQIWINKNLDMFMETTLGGEKKRRR